MGREARVALILTAAGCLLAVMVDWAVQELAGDGAQPDVAAQPADAAVSDASGASQASVEAAHEDTAQEDATEALDATAESHDQA